MNVARSYSQCPVPGNLVTLVASAHNSFLGSRGKTVKMEPHCWVSAVGLSSSSYFVKRDNETVEIFSVVVFRLPLNSKY